jgi:hypothetical protein
MKTQAVHWPATHHTAAAATTSAAQTLVRPGTLWRLLAASLAAAGLSFLAMWSIASGATGLLGASVWLSGLVLLAIAIDAGPQKYAPWLAASAVAVLLLAWLGDRVAPEFSVIGSWVLAGWLAWAIIRRASRHG